MLGKGAAKSITDDDIAGLADELNCHPATLEAIADAESAGWGINYCIFLTTIESLSMNIQVS